MHKNMKKVTQTLLSALLAGCIAASASLFAQEENVFVQHEEDKFVQEEVEFAQEEDDFFNAALSAEAERLLTERSMRALQTQTRLLDTYTTYAAGFETLAEKWPVMQDLLDAADPQQQELGLRLESVYQRLQSQDSAAGPSEQFEQLVPQGRESVSGAISPLAAPPPYRLTEKDIAIISCGTTQMSQPRVMVRPNDEATITVVVGQSFMERGQQYTLQAVRQAEDHHAKIEAVFSHGDEILTFSNRVTAFQPNNCKRTG